MSKEFILVILGLLIALLPTSVLGFPSAWESIFQIIAGIAVAGIAFIIRQERLWREREAQPERRTNAFVENGGMHPPVPRV